MKTLQGKRIAAFTLIELMITLCIIGILASFAIPNFITFRARSMQTEAKANLGSLHRAQTAYQAEHNTYTDNLTELAWRPTGEPRYIYGFVTDATPAPSGVNDSAELLAAIPSAGYSTKNMESMGTPLSDADLPGSTMASGSAFRFGAAANLDADATLDTWVMTESNVISNETNDPST